jgi:hypothetical protein
MEYRELGRTGWKISSISFGAWAIGGSAWGGADDTVSMRALHRALDLVSTSSIPPSSTATDLRAVAGARCGASAAALHRATSGRALDPPWQVAATALTSRRSSSGAFGT